jgi:pimeloyl-ACP methyl ester carboxylesterase
VPGVSPAASRAARQSRIIAAVAPTLSLPTPDGRSLDVWLAGPADGQPLVFHSGTPNSGMPFGLHVEAMAARGIRYVGVTRPGYGGSTRNEGRRVADVVSDTSLVLDHLGIERTWVLGWSGGGPHALAHAALLPKRVLGTALMAGVAPYPAEGLDWMAGMGAENVAEFNAALAGPNELMPFMEPLYQAFREVAPDAIADSFGDLVDEVDRGSITGELAEYLAALMRDAFRSGFWGMFDDDLAFTAPWGFDIGAIPGRVHLWQGAHDRMVPFGHGQWLAAHVGNACPHLVPEHGHLSLVVDTFPQILYELIDGAA